MARKNKETAEGKDVLAAMWKFREMGKRGRLKWAVQFAQEDFDGLTPGRMTDLRLELTAFSENAAGSLGIAMPDEVELVTDIEIQATKQRFQNAITTILKGGIFETDPYENVRYLVGVHSDDAPLIAGTSFLYLDLGTHRLSTSERATHELTFCLGENAHLVKECLAPKPRSKTDEKCGRWYVGRANQNFCSPQCQNRASTQISRRTITDGSHRIRATSSLSRPDGWIASALLFSQDGKGGLIEREILGPRPRYFDGRDEADLYAYELAKKAIAKTQPRKARRKK